MKNDRFVFYDDVRGEETAPGVIRRVLAYSDEMMLVENTFEEGVCGKLHRHSQDQTTYVLSGEFEFEISGVKKILHAGDTVCMKGDELHGCSCRKAGKLLDSFAPYRQDFVKD